MPELPEVETTVRYLKERVEGLTIQSATVLWERTIAFNQAKSFSASLAGSVIAEVFRRGKFVGMKILGDQEQFLYTHLRMSGSLDVIPSSFPIASHDRVVISLSNGKSIRFNDTRKFGRMYLTFSSAEFEQSIGVEPLGDDFTPVFFQHLLSKRKGAIKPTLLDQSIIAGLGNIYVDESLWNARIHPLTPAHTISPAKALKLHCAIRTILSEAVTLLGTDFGDGVVDGGMYRPQVYGRTHEPCIACGTKIRRLIVGQRSTHVCPKCQPSPRRPQRAPRAK